MISEAGDLVELFADNFHVVYQPDIGCNVNYPPEGLDVPIISVEDVLFALQSLRHNSGTSFDVISPMILEGVVGIVSPVLCHVFNRILQFPDAWKIAIVSPVPKKGSQHDVLNYRPISAFGIVPKLFETTVCWHCTAQLPVKLSLNSMIS